MESVSKMEIVRLNFGKIFQTYEIGQLHHKRLTWSTENFSKMEENDQFHKNFRSQTGKLLQLGENGFLLWHTFPN